MRKLSRKEFFSSKIGESIPPAVWALLRERREKLVEQSSNLALKLETAGVPAFAREGAVHYVGVFSHAVVSEPVFRRINFLPVVASQARAFHLRTLEAFVEKRSYVRMVTITSGERCRVDEVRDRVLWLNRRISRFAAACREKGVEVIFRATEFTVDNHGSYHVHAHVLYEPLRKMGDAEWAEFAGWRSDFFGGVHVRDNGRLVNPKEAVKYPFKPADLERLKNEELKQLFFALKGLHMVQPLGSLKEFIACLPAGHNLARVPSSRDAELREWCLVEAGGRKYPAGSGLFKEEDEKGGPAVRGVLAPSYRVGRFCEPVAVIAGAGDALEAVGLVQRDWSIWAMRDGFWGRWQSGLEFDAVKDAEAVEVDGVGIPAVA